MDGFLVVGFLLALAACGDGEPSTAGGVGADRSSEGSDAPPATEAAAPAPSGEAEVPPEPPTFGPDGADAVVDVALVDGALKGAPPTVRGPRVFFTVTNEGTDEHELEVVDAAGERRADTAAMLPGTIVALSPELEPGTYELRCLQPADGGQPYRELGMVATLVVA